MSKLLDFVENKMRMTSIYQPAIIRCLCMYSNNCSISGVGSYVAKRLDGNVKKQDYYTGKLKIYPKQVLAKHGVARVTKVTTSKGEETPTFFMEEEHNSYTVVERTLIIKACDKKIKDYLAKKKEK